MGFQKVQQHHSGGQPLLTVQNLKSSSCLLQRQAAHKVLPVLIRQLHQVLPELSPLIRSPDIIPLKIWQFQPRKRVFIPRIALQ